MTTVKGKKPALLFSDFAQHKNDRWKWGACCAMVRQLAPGYHNLCPHIPAHQETLIKMRAAAAECARTSLMQSMKYPARMCTVFAWLKCEVFAFLPLSFCEHSFVKRHFRHRIICLYTLMSFLCTMTNSVEEKLRRKLPSQFLSSLTSGQAGILIMLLCLRLAPLHTLLDKKASCWLYPRWVTNTFTRWRIVTSS